MRIPLAFLLLSSATLLIGCASTAGRTSIPQPLLAGGHGVDHVTILTNDVTAAAQQYANQLGFTVGPLTAHSFGFTGAHISFADGTFLELYGVHDPVKIAEVGQGFASDAPEGVTWVTLHSGSTTETADLLKQRGISAWGPFTLPDNALPGEWTHRLAGPEQPAFPGGRLYFVEYNEESRAKRRAEDAANVRARETHRNGALGLRSIWVSVRDLTVAAAKYEAAGLRPGPERRMAVLDTKAREITTPGGTILLVQISPDRHSDGAEDSFAGITIKTESIERIRTLLQQSQALELRPYQGLYGRSILLPPTVTRGVSIEFVE